MIENTSVSAQMHIMSAHETKKTTKQKRLQRVRKVALLMGLILIGMYGSVKIQHNRTIEGSATWLESNGQKYLDVNAPTNYDLGYLTGQKIASQIWNLKQVLLLGALTYHTDYWNFIRQAQVYIPYIPHELQEEFQGLADGASNSLGIHIDFNDILIQNCWLDLCYGQLLTNSLNPVACTAIGNQNQNGSITLGQNFDFLQTFQSTLVFVKYRIDSSPTVFSLRFGGGLDLPTGKNSFGLMTLGTVVRTSISGKIAMPLVCRMRNAFLQAKSVDNFVQTFYRDNESNQTFGFNLVISDNSSFIGYENRPDQIFRIKNQTIIKTNTYTNSTWQTVLGDPIFSKERQHLTELLVQNATQNGELTEEELFTILSVQPGICQIANKSTEVQTLAYFSNTYFGLGIPNQKQAGVIPL